MDKKEKICLTALRIEKKIVRKKIQYFFQIKKNVLAIPRVFCYSTKAVT